MKCTFTSGPTFPVPDTVAVYGRWLKTLSIVTDDNLVAPVFLEDWARGGYPPPDHNEYLPMDGSILRTIMTFNTVRGTISPV